LVLSIDVAGSQLCARGGVVARIYDLGSPSRKVFDETYLSTFVYNYLQGLPVFDLHSPLGKLILAIGLALFGDTPVA
jgi:dolichyl-phosphate-mannose--protein O-mannosyl transferase